jgi:hypothetical protein
MFTHQSDVLNESLNEDIVQYDLSLLSFISTPNNIYILPAKCCWKELVRVDKELVHNATNFSSTTTGLVLPQVLKVFSTDSTNSESTPLSDVSTNTIPQIAKLLLIQDFVNRSPLYVLIDTALQFA